MAKLERGLRMRFTRHAKDDPEINLIPFIDVLLVILIFLMLSTTYSKFTELQVTLPVTDSDKLRARHKKIIAALTAAGRYAVNRKPVDGRSVELLAAELTAAAQGSNDAVVVVLGAAAGAHHAGL